MVADVLAPGLQVSVDPEALRRCAWDIGARHADDAAPCDSNYATLAMVSPDEGFATWRITDAWLEQAESGRNGTWAGARLVLRLYDVSFIVFDGLNAHRIRDLPLPRPAGEMFVRAPLAGTFQIAEVGALLSGGEFVPAARSRTTQFPLNAVSRQEDGAALFVDDRLVPEPVASPWESDAFLRERNRPRLRAGVRVALLTCEAAATGQPGLVGTFVSELASHMAALGHDVHVFAPECAALPDDRELWGVPYHPLRLEDSGGPLATALSFTRAAEARLAEMRPFDLYHLQEWMTALAPWLGTRPAILSLTSIEDTRRNGAEPTELSVAIEHSERDAARAAECLIVPAWLRDRAVAALGVDAALVHAFPVEGRPPDEWSCPLDVGELKRQLGLGPVDRVLLFVGPLEHGAGPDLIIDAMRVVLGRTPSVRIVFVGCGSQRDRLGHLARAAGVEWAVRFLGHVEGALLAHLLRASEALLLPARQRMPHDEALVGLGRRAGRPVLTTHTGPRHLVSHEETGLLVYDNPGSLVWGMSRLLEDGSYARHMGQRGRIEGDSVPGWTHVAKRYSEICASSFAELRQRG